MTSMRSGSVPHICVFCHDDPQQTYEEYRIGVINAKGEKYLLTFPESLMHYLQPGPKHDWKLNYHPPQWLIDDFVDPDTTFLFPPGRECLEARSIGYLTSLNKLSKQYGEALLDSAQEAIIKQQFGLDAIVDTHGTDGNVNHGTLAVFKAEPLPQAFYQNLVKIMNSAFCCFQFEKYVDTCCEVEFNSKKKSARSLYNIAYDNEQGWTLTYQKQSSQEKIDIANIPELRGALEKFANSQKIPMTEKFSIEEILKKYHCLTRARSMLPQGLDPVTFQVVMHIPAAVKITKDTPHLDSDTDSDLSSTTEVSSSSQNRSESLPLPSPSPTRNFFRSPSPSTSSASSVEPQSQPTPEQTSLSTSQKKSL
jgi:hypothetical protein